MTWLSCIVSNVVLASLLALAAWSVQRRLRLSAVVRILWVLVLVKLMTPPLVSIPLVELPGTMACTLGVCNCQHGGAQTIMRDTLLWGLLATWSAGAAATLLTGWCRWTQFRRLTAHADAAPPEWQSLAARLSSELSIRCAPAVFFVPGRLPPLVVPGWRRPRILLPMALMGQLNAAQRESLLLHELVHIQRGDHLVRMLELAVGVAYWWLPIVRSIGRHLRACEETCCDAAVVTQLPQARRDYARLLLDVIDFANPLSPQAVPQATAMSASHDLEQRLRAILDANQGTRRTWPAGALAVGLACAILPCELRYDFVGRPASAVTSIEGCEPVKAATHMGSGDHTGELLAAYGCPL